MGYLGWMVSLLRNCIVLFSFISSLNRTCWLPYTPVGRHGHHTIILKLMTLTVLRWEREGDLLSALCDQLNDEGLMRELGDEPCLERLEVGFSTEGNL